MEDNREDVKWSPRVSKAKLKRLYDSTCDAVWDEELIDDVGMTLYMRCRDIINIHRAKVDGEVTCPRCDCLGATTLITREKNKETPMICPVCGWAMTWIEYHRTFQRRQLNPGGAVGYFSSFVTRYEKARDAKSKMLAIDQVIHEFHYSSRELPDQPTRAAGVNLIKGKLTDVVAFLDELSGIDMPDTFQANHRTWRDKQDSIRWDYIREKEKAARDKTCGQRDGSLAKPAKRDKKGT